MTVVDLFEGAVLNRGVRGAPEPRPVWRRSGEPSTSITTLVTLPQVLALLKYPFYPLFILDNGMNLISKSQSVLTPA